MVDGIARIIIKSSPEARRQNCLLARWPIFGGSAPGLLYAEEAYQTRLHGRGDTGDITRARSGSCGDKRLTLGAENSSACDGDGGDDVAY